MPSAIILLKLLLNDIFDVSNYIFKLLVKLSFDEKIRKSPKYLTFLYLTNFFKLQSPTPEKPKETEAPKGTPVNPGIKKKELSKTARMIEVEEYLVKFKNFSYLHCQWLTEEELHRGDKRISQKIKRFKQKREKSANVLDFCEDEHFNPDYVEVDRVLDASIHTDEDTGVVTKHFLVKWRSLPYEDCK